MTFLRHLQKEMKQTEYLDKKKTDSLKVMNK